MARTNDFTECLVDWVDGRLRQNRFSNLWLGGGAGADGGSSYRPIDGQLTQRHICYDTSEIASPCSPSGFSSLVDNLRRIRYWQEPATWFGVTTSGAPPSGSCLNVYIKPGLWYPSTTEYCAFAGGDSPTFTLPSGVLDRVDTVYIDASGILHIQRGTPAAAPTITLPPIASGIPLWAVHLTPTSSGITHIECSGYYTGMGYIERDLRPFLNLGGGAAASGILPASNRGAILRGGVADWETYNIGIANAVLTNDGTDVIWSSKTLIIEENSILNQDLTTDASVTFADVFVPDGGTFGISGNELLTVNAAGNFTFSGVTSIIVPDGAWVGAGVHCAWLFDSSNGNITTRALWIKVGIGTVAPNELLHIKSTTGHAKMEVESTTDNATIFLNAPADEFAYVSFETLGVEDWELVRPANQTYLEIKSSAINLVMVFAKATGNVGIGITPNQPLTVEGTIDLKEQAAANADTASYGQIWVKNTAPNELWFTDDAGTDVQLGVGGGLPAVAGAGYALVSDGVNSWVADQTPAWTGEHSFVAGIAFTGATGVNAITIPDNLANALHIIDAGDADVYLQIVTTTNSEEVIFNAGGDDIDFTVQAVGVADALQVQGSDGQITLGMLTAGYIKSSAGGVLSVVTEVALVDLAGYAQGSIVRGGAADWEALAHPGAAGYALISNATDIVWDQTPAWTGEHSFAAGIAFTGASGANEITVPDNIAIALELLDAGGLEYMRIVSTDANPYFLIDPAGTGIDVGIGTATPCASLNIANVPAGQYGMVVETDNVGRGFQVTTPDFVFNVAGSRLRMSMGAGAGDTYALFQSEWKGTVSRALILNPVGGNVGIGLTLPLAKCHIDQASTTGAIPVLTLDQADTSDGFINFIGSDRGVVAQNVSSLKSVRVELAGTVYRLALYVDA